MKHVCLFLMVCGSLSVVRGASVIVISSTAPVKIASTSELATGSVRVGWASDAGLVSNPALKLRELPDLLTFIGGGSGAAGTSSLTLAGGTITGEIAGFDPSAGSGKPDFAEKQLMVLLYDSVNVDLRTAPDSINWALVMVPMSETAQWNTGRSKFGAKVLGLPLVTVSGALHGRIETDGVFNATTEIGLTPSIPEPGCSVLLLFAVAISGATLAWKSRAGC